METFDAITKRVSMRQYRSDPVEKAILEKLVDAGRRAPTGRRVEPWEFIVVTNNETREKLSQIAEHGPFIKDAACCIAVYCKDTKYYLEDGCAATENILLAATNLGLGTCWVAGDKKPYAIEVSRLLEVPQDYKLVSLISIGWPGREKSQIRNREVKDVIHWEKF